MLYSLTAGKTLEEIADIRNLRRKKLYITFSIIAIILFGVYSAVNFTKGNGPHAFINLLGFILGVVSYCKLKGLDTYNSPLLLNISVLINGAAHIVLPERMMFWVYPAIATIIIINEFRTALLCSIVFTAFTGGFLFAEELGLIPISFAYTLPNEKFFISYIINCIACLAANIYFQNANEYLKKLYQSGIEELAYWDSLTGLANRHSFESWATDELKVQENKDGITALIFLDIDNFKQLNDTYGHDVGDNILVHFSQRLLNSLRGGKNPVNEKEFSTCRYAGDEFVVLLSGLSDKDELMEILECVGNLGFDLPENKSGLKEVTFSAGVSIFKQDADTLSGLIQKADQAMYVSKGKGKNQYSLYQACL